MRRTYVLLAAALCALSLPLRAAEPEKKPPPDIDKADILAEFPMLGPDEPLLVPVKIGKKTYTFMLDTGASFNAFDISLRGALGRSRRRETVSALMAEMKATFYEAPAASMGGLEVCKGSLAACFDLKSMREASGRDIRGIVGMTFLKNHILRLDFEGKKFQIVRAGTRSRKSWGTPLRMKVKREDNCAYVLANTGAGAAGFMLDTGFAGSGLLSPAMFKSAVPPGRRKENRVATVTGEARPMAGRTALLVLGNCAQTEAVVGAADRDVLGLGFLRRYVVTLDFPGRRIYFRKRKRSFRPDRGFLIGLSMSRRGGRTVIDEVEAGSPGAAAGLRPGDLLLKMAGKLAGKHSMTGLGQMIYEAEGKKLKLEIRRGERVLEVELAVKDSLPAARTVPLHAAVLAGDAEALKKLLAGGEKTDVKNWAGTTALHLAAMLGRREIARLLIEKGANLEARTRGGSYAPLHFAAINGRLGVARLLIEKGAKVGAPTAQGRVPLHMAAVDGSGEMIKLLLGKGAKVDARTTAKATPLTFAINEDNARNVRLLLDKGAEVDARPASGDTPLLTAAMRGNKEIVELLLARGADLKARNSVGTTAMHWAAYAGHLEVVKLLKENGLPVDARTRDRSTSLHAAAGRGFGEVVAYLLKAGAALEAGSAGGETPLYWAAYDGQMEAVELLLAAGARLEAADKRGWTPLITAAGRHEDVGLFLLKKGAKAGAATKEGLTPLHSAARAGSVGLIKALLAKGVDVNARTDKRITPLHVAAWRGHKAAAELLIAKGADVNAEMADGQTVIEAARGKKRADIVKLLIKHGAKEKSKLFGE